MYEYLCENHTVLHLSLSYSSNHNINAKLGYNIEQKTVQIRGYLDLCGFLIVVHILVMENINVENLCLFRIKTYSVFLALRY
jgi:hypothetical protein